MSADRPSGGKRQSGSKGSGAKGAGSQGSSSKQSWSSARGAKGGGKASAAGGGKASAGAGGKASAGGGGRSSATGGGRGGAKSGAPSGGKGGSTGGAKSGGQSSRSSASRSGGRSGGKPGGKAGGAPSRRPSGTRDGGDRSRKPRPDTSTKPTADKSQNLFDEELIALARSERVLPADVKAELQVFHARVADLLGAAYLLVEEAPEEALRYALEAKRHASRSPAVREACGMAAYYAGQFDVAIKELRTARRLTGRDDLVPLIADCERALGHPQKAIDMATEPLRLSEDDQVELRIVAAGARMDLGQPEAAALLLRIPLLKAETASQSSARLKYAYAEAMLAAGDPAQAREWFARAAVADIEGDLDAQERLDSLEDPHG